jgi:hypothetical protein
MDILNNENNDDLILNLSKNIIKIVDEESPHLDKPPGLNIQIDPKKIASMAVTTCNISPFILNQIIRNVNQNIIKIVFDNYGFIFGTYIMNQLYINIINSKIKSKTPYENPEHSFRHLEMRKIDVIVPYTHIDIVIQTIKRLYNSTFDILYPNIVNTNYWSNLNHIPHLNQYKYIELTIFPFEECYKHNLPLEFKPSQLIVNILSPIHDINSYAPLDIPLGFIQFENEAILYDGTNYFVSSQIIPYNEYYGKNNSEFMNYIKSCIENKILIVMQNFNLNIIKESLNSGFTLIYNYRTNDTNNYSLFKMRKILFPTFCYHCGCVIINNIICEMTCCNIGYHPECLYKLLINDQITPKNKFTCISCKKEYLDKEYPDIALSYNSLAKYLHHT